MSFYPAPTTGVGVPETILVPGSSGSTIPGKNAITLSLSSTNFPNTFQLSPDVVDATGAPVTLGTQFTLTAVAASSGGAAVYTGTVTGGGSNAFAGKTFTVAGFAGANNDGTFICTASTATTATLENGAATAETHAATATEQESTVSLTYNHDGSSNIVAGTKTNVVSVSATGVITAGAQGGVTVEVVYAGPGGKVYGMVPVTVVK